MSKKTTRRRKNKKLGRAVRFKILLCLALLFIIYAIVGFRVRIEPAGGRNVTVEYGQPYSEEKAKAYVSRFLGLKKTPLEVKSEGSVDPTVLGTYELTYEADYLWVHEKMKQTVKVVDTTPPELTLVQNPDAYTLPGHEYREEGYSAIDAYDGDVTANVQVRQENGIVYYEVTDSNGNKASAERTIVYDDRIGPVISVDGGLDITLHVGNPYYESYSAVDDLDGDVTGNVEVSGSVDTSKVGDNYIHYSVKDSYGNLSEADRVVHVVEAWNDHREDNGKIIYLTFDDGPGPYTERLLDILLKYNVKATFFVTGNEKYRYLLSREASDGHTVAVHTNSHRYESIYANTDNYWNDFETMESIIEQQTGSRTNLFRFPGGSSNTISRNYSRGIMKKLSGQAYNKGLVYFDWNVSSGDAGQVSTPEGVYNNIVNEVQKHDISVVLCHDIKEYTVNAMESVIKWGIDNGYTFLNLSEGSYDAHHPINN